METMSAVSRATAAHQFDSRPDPLAKAAGRESAQKGHTFFPDSRFALRHGVAMKNPRECILSLRHSLHVGWVQENRFSFPYAHGLGCDTGGR